MQNHFRVEVRSHGPATVLSLTGELDLASSPSLEQELAKASGSGPLIVDLRGIEFIDSTGLSVLVKAHQQAVESDRPFGVVRGGPQVQRLFALTGMEERLTLADTPEELLRAG